VEAYRIVRCSGIPNFLDNPLTDGDDFVNLTRRLHFKTQKNILILISVRGSLNLNAIVWLEGLDKL
jgi:hypothetical protein